MGIKQQLVGFVDVFGLFENNFQVYQCLFVGFGVQCVQCMGCDVGNVSFVKFVMDDVLLLKLFEQCQFELVIVFNVWVYVVNKLFFVRDGEIGVLMVGFFYYCGEIDEWNVMLVGYCVEQCCYFRQYVQWGDVFFQCL